ncbi:OLC1v1003043C1 [Oldenlandia corymbosa var. corymbosa]|uniref:OLC1v1003043C1 n=1 Tax=Oldenlandia corymbosa var. corymbosa TaxID=529605 RepID=A0AAV1D972_OLDCO|nr:OLC1v1003043C1 [Oldenlandia corymbosa var. corymbosa]
MVSDSELLKRLREILGSSDLDTATAGSIRRQLEEEFKIDLQDRKAFIREQIDIFLESEDPESQNDGGGGDREEDENNQEMDAEEEDGDDEEGEGSDDEAVKGRASKAKKRGSGFTKPCAISPQLQEVVGVPEMARTEVVKKLWEYIRAKDLQNPKDKRKIICDEALRGIFKVNTINMFQMNKALSKHIWPIEYEDETPVVESPPEKKKLKRSRQEDVEEEPKGKGKQQKGKPSGFLAPLPLSSALVEFLGTGESALPRSDVVKRMWTYIKDNDLQDPKDRRKIICDDKLNKLFKVRSFTGFTVSKLLKPHFVKTGG